jgi:hypothetical protein
MAMTHSLQSSLRAAERSFDEVVHSTTVALNAIFVVSFILFFSFVCCAAFNVAYPNATRFLLRLCFPFVFLFLISLVTFVILTAELDIASYSDLRDGTPVERSF